jgi:hypothetical protein
VLTLHVFEKVRALDITLAEFEQLLDGGQVIEETPLRMMELKQVILVLDWLRPLHVVAVVDDVRQEERIITVYEPDSTRWANSRERRR